MRQLSPSCTQQIKLAVDVGQKVTHGCKAGELGRQQRSNQRVHMLLRVGGEEILQALPQSTAIVGSNLAHAGRSNIRQRDGEKVEQPSVEERGILVVGSKRIDHDIVHGQHGTHLACPGRVLGGVSVEGEGRNLPHSVHGGWRKRRHANVELVGKHTKSASSIADGKHTHTHTH